MLAGVNAELVPVAKHLCPVRVLLVKRGCPVDWVATGCCLTDCVLVFVLVKEELVKLVNGVEEVVKLAFEELVKVVRVRDKLLSDFCPL